MNFKAGQLVFRHGPRTLRLGNIIFPRRRASDGPCPPSKDTTPSGSAPGAEAPPAGSTSPPPPPTPPPSPPPPPQESCPQPQQPCPTLRPICPPNICEPCPDPNNPCNYTPPQGGDGDFPDLKSIKKLQCKFQEDNDIPVYLKGGKTDVILYHTTIIMVALSFAKSLYHIIGLMLK